jgi:hypothetical protein
MRKRIQKEKTEWESRNKKKIVAANFSTEMKIIKL